MKRKKHLQKHSTLTACGLPAGRTLGVRIGTVDTALYLDPNDAGSCKRCLAAQRKAVRS